MIRNPQDKSEIIVLIAYWVGVALIITFAKYGKTINRLERSVLRSLQQQMHGRDVFGEYLLGLSDRLQER